MEEREGNERESVGTRVRKNQLLRIIEKKSIDHGFSSESQPQEETTISNPGKLRQ